MPAPLAIADQMTIEEFLAFTDARPDGERWELIEGQAIMNASPTDWHQQIVVNVSHLLLTAKNTTNAPWFVLLGVGTRVPVSPNSLPQPDLFVKEHPLTGAPTTNDALVIFEFLSKSNRPADRAWRKRVYTSVPNCAHYVTIAIKEAEIERFDRADGWKGAKVNGLRSALALSAIGVHLSLHDIYRWTLAA
jgi:Uma2 family endonuclease